MTQGGISAARKAKGARLETAVVKDQRRIGRWAERVRQGQGTPVDVVALDKGSKLLIQCKADGWMSPAEREALTLESAQAGAIPLLAWKADGAVQYKEIEL